MKSLLKKASDNQQFGMARQHWSILMDFAFKPKNEGLENLKMETGVP